MTADDCQISNRKIDVQLLNSQNINTFIAVLLGICIFLGTIGENRFLEILLWARWDRVEIVAGYFWYPVHRSSIGFGNKRCKPNEVELRCFERVPGDLSSY